MKRNSNTSMICLLIASVACNLLSLFSVEPNESGSSQSTESRRALPESNFSMDAEGPLPGESSRTLSDSAPTHTDSHLVELPWQLVRPLLVVVPFNNKGELTGAFVKSLGLSHEQASRMSRIAKSIITEDAVRIADSAVASQDSNGVTSVNIPPGPNKAIEKLGLEFDALKLPNQTIIKSILQDSVRNEEQLFGRTIMIRRNGDGSFTLVEEFNHDGKQMGYTENRYPGKNAMPLEYALIYDRYFHQ
jgi:hypothetical protein